MNTPSASPAEGRAGDRILVWDLPVRVFHWLLAASFLVAYVTSEGERWRLVHVTAGYTMAGLVAFRLLWGFAGTRHARFASFLRRPAAALDYLKGLAAGHPAHHVGHNPAGGWAVVLLLGLSALAAASGWAVYNDLGPEALEEVHEFAGNALLAVVIVHLLAVVASSVLHRENLVAAMLSGRKPGSAADGATSARRGVAVLLLAAVLGLWAWQWRTAPPAGAATDAGAHAGQDRDDDD